MTAYLFMVFGLFWCPCALGQYYYQPEFYSAIPEPYFANPNVFYRPYTAAYQFSAPENNFEAFQYNAPPQMELKTKFSDSSDRFRGFGYHNKFGDDATSTVVFLSGFARNNLENVAKERITVTSNEGVASQALKNFEDTVKETFVKTSTAKSTKSLKFENSKPVEEASFSSLAPMVKDFLENSIPSGPVYYFYLVPEENEPSIESRALFASENETNGDVINTTTERNKKEFSSTEKSAEKKAEFVIEYKNSSTEIASTNSTTSTTSTTTTVVSETTTDSASAMPDQS